MLFHRMGVVIMCESDTERYEIFEEEKDKKSKSKNKSNKSKNTENNDK